MQCNYCLVSPPPFLFVLPLSSTHSAVFAFPFLFSVLYFLLLLHSPLQRWVVSPLSSFPLRFILHLLFPFGCCWATLTVLQEESNGAPLVVASHNKDTVYQIKNCGPDPFGSPTRLRWIWRRSHLLTPSKHMHLHRSEYVWFFWGDSKGQMHVSCPEG